MAPPIVALTAQRAAIAAQPRTAFFALVAYSCDASNFAFGTNFVMKSVGFDSSRTCPISHSPARTRCTNVW